MPALDRFFSYVEIDLQSVWLYGFNPQRFVESGATDFEIRVPDAGRVTACRRYVKRVETIPGVAVDEFRVELPVWRVHLHGHRVAVRDQVFLVLEDHRDVQGIARPPDTSLSIDEGLQPFVKSLSAHVEAAQTVFFSLGHLQVAG